MESERVLHFVNRWENCNDFFLSHFLDVKTCYIFSPEPPMDFYAVSVVFDQLRPHVRASLI